MPIGEVAGYGPALVPQQVSVTDQRRDPNSLLVWFERMLHTLRECQEIGTGTHDVLDIGPPQLLVHKAIADSGCMLFLHNLAPTPCRIRLPAGLCEDQPPLSLAADGDYGDDIDPSAIDVSGYGYRWIRLRRQP